MASGARGGGRFDELLTSNQEIVKAIQELAETARRAEAREDQREAQARQAAQVEGGGIAGRSLGTRAQSSLMGDKEGSGLAGFVGQQGMDLLGFMPQALASAGSYAASRTPYGTTGTTDMLGQNLEMGLLDAVTNATKGVPVVGPWLRKQFEGFEEAVYAPEQRARGKLSPAFERMAMSGIDASDKDIREAFEFAIPIERRGVYMKQRVERIGAAVNAENGSAISGAFSQIGL